MRRSIATVSLSGTLEEKLRAVAAAHFGAVELFENDLINFSGTPRQVGQLARDLGLAIDLFQPFRDFEGVSDDVFRRNLDRAERKFDVMTELGAPMMLVCSNVSSHAIDDDRRAAASSMSSPSEPLGGTCRSRMRPWPGAPTCARSATPGGLSRRRHTRTWV